ncbi:unnamed protein product [Somion occarium]|uniref:F-box domain-containing protein n=1 Tax=Somion occarium TaxID=3059160 RepID=A0ABP1E6E4_9APHY
MYTTPVFVVRVYLVRAAWGTKALVSVARSLWPWWLTYISIPRARTYLCILLSHIYRMDLGFSQRIPSISSLPDDVLAEVFMQFASVYLVSLDAKSSEDIVELSHVCRHWYYLMLDLSLLWSRIQLDAPVYAQQFLTRSRNAPISLHARFLTSSCELNIRPHLSRVKSIRVFGTEDGLRALFCGLDAQIQLDQLTDIEIGGRLGAPVRISIDAHRFGHSLRSLILMNVCLKAPGLRQVDSAELVFSSLEMHAFSPMLDTIKAIRDVKKLRVTHKLHDGSLSDRSSLLPPPILPPSIDKITLPILEELSITDLYGAHTLTLLDLIMTPKVSPRIHFPEVQDLIHFFSATEHPVVRRMQSCSSGHCLGGDKDRHLHLGPIKCPSGAACTCPTFVFPMGDVFTDVQALAQVLGSILITHFSVTIHSGSGLTTKGWETLVHSLNQVTDLDIEGVHGTNAASFVFVESLDTLFDTVWFPNLMTLRLHFVKNSSDCPSWHDHLLSCYCLDWLLELMKNRNRLGNPSLNSVTFAIPSCDAKQVVEGSEFRESLTILGQFAVEIIVETIESGDLEGQAGMH